MESQDLPLLGFFCDIDLFGNDVDIYYKGKPKRNTWIGRILTILYIGIYLFFFIYRVIRMANKEDVTFYDTYAFNGVPPFMQLNHEIFYSGVALIHPLYKVPFVNPSIYNVKMTYLSGVKNGFGFDNVITDVPIEVCDISKVGSNYRELFKKKDLDNYYCVKDFNLFLEGHQTYDVYSYMKIEFFPCVNSTENNNKCASKELIAALLNKFGVTFAMQDIDLTPQDYEKPIDYRLKEVSLTVASDMYLEVHSYWRVVNIETDEDIFGLGTSNNIRKEKYLKYDSAQILYSTNKLDLDNQNSPLITFTVGLSEQELTETRTYPKLIAVIGDVGGFMEVIFSLFGLIATVLTETLYTKSLVNHLFSFDLDKKLVLIKKKNIKLFKTQKTIKTYNPDKCLQNNNNIYNIYKNKNGKEQNAVKYESRNIIKKDNNKNNNNNSIINNLQNQKNNNIDITSKRKSKINISKKTTTYNTIFDMKVKSSKYPNEDKVSSREESNRKLRLIKNNNNNISIINISNFEENKETDKESTVQKDINDNIITSIELNQFKPQFCYTKKRENIEKILLEEAMKIILVKLDIQNLFKKICKDDPITDEENSEYDFIEMSDVCKNQLRNLLDRQIRTLVI